jgi:hypothetical protein
MIFTTLVTYLLTLSPLSIGKIEKSTSTFTIPSLVTFFYESHGYGILFQRLPYPPKNILSLVESPTLVAGRGKDIMRRTS